jgi:hypothetical protein
MRAATKTLPRLERADRHVHVRAARRGRRRHLTILMTKPSAVRRFGLVGGTYRVRPGDTGEIA